MPVASITLEEVNRTILTEVYQKVVREILDAIKVPYSSAVILNKDIEITPTDNKINAVSSSKDNTPFTISQRRVIVSVTEDYDEDELTSTAVHQRNNFPFFYDVKTDVSVSPIYVKNNINIELNYISPSKIEANRIRDDIRIRLSQTRNILHHEIEYDVLIPRVVEEFIADVYDLRNRLIPQPIEEYFRENATKRIHLITDMANPENSRLAVYEKQVRIVGIFDFSGNPEKVEMNNEENNYKVSLNYKLSIDVPRALVMRYPVIICNRTLPSKYLQHVIDHKVKSMEEHKQLYSSSWSLTNLSHFESHRQLENRIDIKLPINIPLFDDFTLMQGHRGYGILASFLTDVDETDNKTLLNLKELGDYCINPEILEAIRTYERERVTVPYKSFIYLGLHQDGVHFDNSILEIDEDLNVRSASPLSLFKPTRVTLSIILDLNMLEPTTLNRLMNSEIFPVYLREYMNMWNNFKTEASRTIFTETTTNRNYIKILYRYVDIGDVDKVREILDIYKEDSYIYGTFISSVYYSYPALWGWLHRHGLLTRHEIDSFRYKATRYTYPENYAMKTVMTSSIIVSSKK